MSEQVIEELQPAFSVVNPVTGHRYEIFAHGEIRGFDLSEPTVIINRIPLLLAKAKLDGSPH